MITINSKVFVGGSNIQAFNTPISLVAGSILYLDAGNTISYPGTGTNWYDISGQGMTASLVNTPTYQSTTGSFRLNGTNQYMSVTPNATLNALNGFTNSYTIEVWAKSADPSPAGTFAPRLIEKRAATGVYPISIQINHLASEKTLGFIFDNTNVPGALISDGPDLWNNTWKQIVFVADFAADNLKAYKNGSFFSSSINTTTTNTNNAANFYIGTNGGLSTPFAGEIAIVRVYNTALTAEEINTNWFATKDRFGL